MRKAQAVVQARRTVIQCKGVKMLDEKRPPLFTDCIGRNTEAHGSLASQYSAKPNSRPIRFLETYCDYDPKEHASR
jgi:hypothetical protein